MSRLIASFAAMAIAVSSMTVSATAGDVVDGTGATVKVENLSRLLSIGSDTTEILFALGLGNQIVAVDSTSTYPAEAKSKKIVGYLRALSTEGVIATGASLILANAHIGPPEVVRALRSSSVPMVILPGGEGPASLGEKVRLIGRAVAAEEKAEALVAKLERDFQALGEARSKVKKPLRAMVVLGVSGGRTQAGGKNTTADLMLNLAGAENVATSLQGYKPVSDEAVIELAPEVIVAARRTPDEDIASQIAALPGFKALGAGGKVPIIVVDATYLLGFGPRAPEAAWELMARIYPDQPR